MKDQNTLRRLLAIIFEITGYALCFTWYDWKMAIVLFLVVGASSMLKKNFDEE